jgi:transposase-like protein
MSKQHSTDFKLSAIELYIKLNSIREVSELLNCSKSSLHRWIERYFETDYIERKNYKDRGSIITNEILKYINVSETN